jgi:serine/threonine protein kinase
MPDTAIQRIGRYEILEEIGRGAMGVVFKGRDPLIGRLVAVKTITSGVAESKDLLERFYREARAAGGLQHPNIVTIYELAESGGAPFIAMEYLEGESLDRLIARKPALPLATKAAYVLQACRALDYAHRRGVIHRDIKPANIVVTREDVVKVVDFGIARLADASKTQTGTVLGTLAYMSPELVRGEHADARGDIWALGAVLYELLAYQRPFTGENHAALLMNILQQEPPSIRQFVPQCPAALERIILKALQKDEKLRYPSMEAFLKNLEDVHASLARDGARTAALPSIPMASGDQVAPVKSGTESGGQPAATLRMDSHTIASGEIFRAAASLPKSGAPKTGTSGSAKGILTAPAAPTSHPVQKALAVCAILAVIVLGGIAVLRRDPDLSAAASMAANRALARIEKLPLPAAAARVLPLAARRTPVASPAGSQTPPTTLASDVPTPDASSDAPAKSASPSPVEDQQRYLINLAHQAADRQDYKSAQEQLDEAAKLNGPLNDSIADLRRQFTAQSRAAELESIARDEQTLWDKAMEYMDAGEFDDADASLRDILTIPEGGHHWADAARYVDQVIPARRQEEQLWAAVQQEANSKDPGHLLAEVKALDDVLAFGGWHEQGARQKRDALIAAVIRGEAERNRRAVAALSAADEWQMTRLKNHFDDLVRKGDAGALEELQQLQTQFQSVAEAQGPLAFDARDYVNNILPQAESHITDRLALAQANSAPNAAFLDAVKEYDRAVAAQNAAALRDKVLPLFTGIAQSGGVRAKEAQHYVDVLVPEALNPSGQ